MSIDRGNAKVLVIGGGPAGSACAISLRQLGVGVTLAERAVFPRIKVCGCCLGGGGIAELDRLGVLEQVTAASAPTQSWRGFFDGRRIDLPLDQGIAVSREHLDAILIQQAEVMGTSVITPCSAAIESEDANGVTARLGDSDRDEKYDCVVVASGLKSGDVGGRLPWLNKPHGPFGVSFMAKSDRVEDGVIYMACDDDGYVGLIRLANGSVDVAAALRSGSDAAKNGDPSQRVMRMLQQNGVDVDLEPITPLLTTPPLRRTRLAGSGRILAIGDAASYVEPFTGEGMTWAMQSAREAAKLIAEKLNAGHSSDITSVGDAWAERSERLLAGKKRACSAITSALTSKLARLATAATLSRFPSLAKPLLAHLAKP